MIQETKDIELICKFCGTEITIKQREESNNNFVGEYECQRCGSKVILALYWFKEDEK